MVDTHGASVVSQLWVVPGMGQKQKKLTTGTSPISHKSLGPDKLVKLT